ncbi:MAG: SMP-30/gluconolactonase/LRE family protein [Maribacter sp.]|nr:SMP-30/gluconolactonase/LRE family protein [Maribacter sp.]
MLGSLATSSAQTPTSSDFMPESSFTEGIEGPAVDKEGMLYAVNFKEQGTIGKVNKEGKGEIFLRLPGKSVGNGIRFDREGNMYIADYVGHAIYQVKKGSNNPEVWVQDSRMSQPNDLAISPNGILYLSDPNWANGTGSIWMVNTDKKIILLESNMGTTNGIEVSPDGKRLYVNESLQRNIWQYDINEDGSLSNKTKFLSFDDYGMDGMRCDMQGNLYIARYDKGTVLIVSPEGKTLQEVVLKGKKPSNITFGGVDGKTCFVTMADRGCFETFPALNSGNYYNLVH